MELYITVSFWLGVFCLVVNLLSLATCKFPSVKEETVGMKTAQVLIGTGFAVWAGFLLYANNAGVL